jgi:Phosphodiester glycosidase
MMRKLIGTILLLWVINAAAQVKWVNADADFGPLPANFHVYKTTDSLDGKPFIAYYAEATLKDKKLHFTADTTYKRRLTPQQFFEKNAQPLLVVNTTFFSFATNQNLNVVIKEGKLVSYNVHSIAGKGKDTLTYRHPLGSAIGISKKRKADVAWLFADSGTKKPYMFQVPFTVETDSFANIRRRNYRILTAERWKMQTAVGGGPVLVQNGEIKITNNEELKFSGKTGLTDKHPRTAMGYTADGRLIIMVIQGRSANAAGATLVQEAQLLKELGCVEALNLDGGGSSCMLINGKPTISVSDKEGQRPVPAVFIIK